MFGEACSAEEEEEEATQRWQRRHHRWTDYLRQQPLPDKNKIAFTLGKEIPFPFEV